MKKTLLYLSLATIALFNFSCNDDKDADEVIPEMEVTMERCFMYRDTHETTEASYTTNEITSSLTYENERLTIYLDGSPDQITFEIEEADLADGFVGIYSLKSLPDPEAGKAKTTYIYNNNDGSGSAYFSEGNFMSGSVEITGFNKDHNLLSGTFELTMEDVPDPTLTSPTPAPRRTDVTITGTFRNAGLITKP